VKRVDAYKRQGTRFAKWRAVYNVSDTLPSPPAVESNAEALARYAAICQEQGFVPVVEPEVLIDGSHTMARCAEVTEVVLHEVFHALRRHRVVLEHMLLKPSMVGPARRNACRGGCTDDPDPAAHGARRLGPQPWQLSFSYGRALQEPILQAWKA
jgi:fructose-bisphosphate aldolase class I